MKDPAHGSLGRADGRVLAAVIEAVGGRRPVSAALGELAEWQGGDLSDLSDLGEIPPGVRFVKWGLAGCVGLDWRRALAREVARLADRPGGCQLVAVAYADWQRARAPSVREVARFAREHGCPALLIDTSVKDGRRLLDWLTESDLRETSETAGVPLALAGSLTADDITRLLPLNPGWFAVRGAACLDGRRDRPVERRRVELLAGLLREPRRSARNRR